jgi:hypothetical protein
MPYQSQSQSDVGEHWRRARRARVTVKLQGDIITLSPLDGFGQLRSERPAVVFRSARAPGVDVLVAPADDSTGRPVAVYRSGVSAEQVRIVEGAL